MAPPPLRAGARVTHPDFGPGLVRGVMDGGRVVLVEFDGRPRTPFLLPASVVKALGAPAAPTRPPPPPPPPPRPAPRFESIDRQALEALRLGVVPVRGLDRITVGREEETERIRQLVTDAPDLLLVSGEYGSGKTHLIELAENLALREGMLVARATFDPVEVPPSHPLRIYAALTTELRYPDVAARGLGPLFERLAQRFGPEGPPDLPPHRWFSPALWASATFGHDPLVDALLDFVAGQTDEDAAELTTMLRRRGWTGPSLLGLPDYRTFGQILAYQLGGLAAWARAAGWKGLLVLLDEAEFIDRLGATSRAMAQNVLSYLAAATLPSTRLAFDPSRVYRGGQASHRAIPERYLADQPLAVLCAFTPNPDIDAALRALVRGGDARMALDPLPARLFGLLAERVLSMFQELYPGMDPSPQFRHQVRAVLLDAYERGEIATTRQAARLVVEYWDLWRTDPARAARAAR